MTPTSQTPDSQLMGWLRALAIYKDPRVLAMLFLGFSAGLPFALVAGTLAAWLTRSGVSMSEIGLFSLVGILYAFKFAWAPIVDQVALPGLTKLLGRRRSWMLVAQAGVAAALFAMSTTNPSTQVAVLAIFALIVALSSATQDIAVDAWRIEIAPTEQQAALAAAYQLGYRIALLVASAGALFIAGTWSWPVVYKVMALLMGIGIVTTLVVNEPTQNNKLRAKADRSGGIAEWFANAVLNPVVDFFERNASSAFLILALIGVYRISDMVLGVMANPFYLDIGFSELQIAGYAKTVGFGATIAGAAIGGISVARLGLGGPLVFGAVILAITNLAFAGLAIAGPNVPLFVLTICADNLAQGFTGTVFIAYLSGLTNVAYTATQYALFTSLMVLPGRLLSGVSGFVVDEAGWVSFFFYAALMGVPAILLAVIIRRRRIGAGEGSAQ